MLMSYAYDEDLSVFVHDIDDDMRFKWVYSYRRGDLSAFTCSKWVFAKELEALL